MAVPEVSPVGSAGNALPVSRAAPVPAVARAAAAADRAPGGALGDGGPALGTAYPPELAEAAGFFLISEAQADAYLGRARQALSIGPPCGPSGYALLDDIDEDLSLGALAPREIVAIARETLQGAASGTGAPILRFLASAAELPSAARPSSNTAAAKPTAKAAMIAFDQRGHEGVFDVFVSKIAADRLELAAYRRADRSADGGFPYVSAAALIEALALDPTTGALALLSANPQPLAVAAASSQAKAGGSIRALFAAVCACALALLILAMLAI